MEERGFRIPWGQVDFPEAAKPPFVNKICARGSIILKYWTTHCIPLNASGSSWSPHGRRWDKLELDEFTFLRPGRFSPDTSPLSLKSDHTHVPIFVRKIALF